MQFNNLAAKKITATVMVNELGLQWDIQTDMLSLTFKSPILTATTLVTKQKVSRVFPPLGLSSSVTIKAKIFMQTLWQCNVDWNEPEDQREWLNIAHDIQEAMIVNIPRTM